MFTMVRLMLITEWAHKISPTQLKLISIAPVFVARFSIFQVVELRVRKVSFE